MSEWISIKDRLPEAGVPIYANRESRGVIDATFVKMCYATDEIIFKTAGLIFIDDVTHWMLKEYPEPPQAEKRSCRPFYVLEDSDHSIFVAIESGDSEVSKVVGLAARSECGAHKAADILNDLWSQREEPELRTAREILDDAHRMLFEWAKGKEKCIGCIRFYSDGEDYYHDADSSVPYCHGLFALEGKCRFGGSFLEIAKRKQKAQEKMWSFDGKIIKFGPSHLCGKLFHKTDLDDLVQFLNDLWEHNEWSW